MLFSWLQENATPPLSSKNTASLISRNKGQALVFLDNFRSHCTETVERFCLAKGISTAMLPPNITPWSQPLDIGCNKPFKDGVKAEARHSSAFIDDAKAQGAKNAVTKFQIFSVVKSLAKIKGQTVSNSFRHMFLFAASSPEAVRKLKEKWNMK